MQKTMIAFVAVLIAALATIVLAQPAEEDSLERGRELTAAFYAGEMEPIAAAFVAEMTDAVGGEDGLLAFRDQLLQQYGEEVEVLEEHVEVLGDLMVYTRVARFSNYGGPMIVQWALQPDGKIGGFNVQAQAPQTEAESPHLDYQTQADLRLPFDGEWTVFWGGRSVQENYHAAYPDQRFALDLVIVRDGHTHTGDGGQNSDYHCFGHPILAPAGGVVVATFDEAPDNEPGEFEDDSPLGNHVIIDHGTGEYSFLAHLRQGSVAVQSGQSVEAGEVIGECGNSGRSSEPHLHYHLQDSPEFGMGAGMPAQFQGYTADGESVERGEPVQGQVIAPLVD